MTWRPLTLPSTVLTALCATAVITLVPGVAEAHDPIIIDDAQTTPESGPLLLDGTISFALYGVVNGPGDTRGFRVRMSDNTRLIVSLLVPDLAPENELTIEELPTLRIDTPDGSTETFAPDTRVVFDEPFSGTRYVRLLDLDEPAVAGDYAITVTGARPARFTVSVGTIEQFGTRAENVADRSLGVGGVLEWYATAPPAAPVTTAVPTTIPAVATTTVATVTAPPVTTTSIATTPDTGDTSDSGDTTASDTGDDRVSRPVLGRLRVGVLSIGVLVMALVITGVLVARRRRRR